MSSTTAQHHAAPELHTRATASEVAITLSQYYGAFSSLSKKIEETDVYEDIEGDDDYTFPKVYTINSADREPRISVLPSEERNLPLVTPGRWMNASFIDDTLAFCKYVSTNRNVFLDSDKDYISHINVPSDIGSHVALLYTDCVSSLGSKISKETRVLVNSVEHTQSESEMEALTKTLWKEIKSRLYVYYGYAISYLLVPQGDARAGLYKKMIYALACDIMIWLEVFIKLDSTGEQSLLTTLALNTIYHLDKIEELKLSSPEGYQSANGVNVEIYETTFQKKIIPANPFRTLLDNLSKSPFWNTIKTTKRHFVFDYASLSEFCKRIFKRYVELQRDPISDKLSYWWSEAKKILDIKNQIVSDEDHEEDLFSSDEDVYDAMSEDESKIEDITGGDSTSDWGYYPEGRLKSTSNNFGQGGNNNDTGGNSGNTTTTNNNTNTNNNNNNLVPLVDNESLASILDVDNLMEHDANAEQSVAGKKRKRGPKPGARKRRKIDENSSELIVEGKRKAKQKANDSIISLNDSMYRGITAPEENKPQQAEEPPKKRRPGRPKKNASDPTSEDSTQSLDAGELADMVLDHLEAPQPNRNNGRKNGTPTTAKGSDQPSDGTVQGTVSNLVIKEEVLKPVAVESMIGVDDALSEIYTLALKIKYSERFNFEESAPTGKSDKEPRDIIQSSVLRGGLLLYGPPGTGKTIMAPVLYNVCESRGIKVHPFNEGPSTVMSPYVGESEKYVETLFKVANERAKQDNQIIYNLKNQKPNPRSNPAKNPLAGYDKSISVIYIDEADSILTPSSGSDTSKNAVVTTFQSMIIGNTDVSNIKVVGSTNYPWRIPLPMRQRFTQGIFVGVPDDDARYLKILYRVYQRIYQKNALKTLGLENNTTLRRIEIMESHLKEEFKKIEDCVMVVNKFAMKKFGILLGLKPITLDWIKYYLVPLMGRRDQIKSQELRAKIKRVNEYINRAPNSLKVVTDIEQQLDQLYESMYLEETPQDNMEVQQNSQETEYFSTVSRDDEEKETRVFNDEGQILGDYSYEDTSNQGFEEEEQPRVVATVLSFLSPNNNNNNNNTITATVATLPQAEPTDNTKQPEEPLSRFKQQELAILKSYADSTLSKEGLAMEIRDELVDAIYNVFGSFDDFLNVLEKPDLDKEEFELTWQVDGQDKVETFTVREAVQIINEHYMFTQRKVPPRKQSTKLEFGLSLRELDLKINSAFDSCTQLMHTVPYPIKYLYPPIQSALPKDECKFILNDYKDYGYFASGYWTQYYTPQKYTSAITTKEGLVRADDSGRHEKPKPVSREFPPVFEEKDFNDLNYYNPEFNSSVNATQLKIAPYLITRDAFTTALSKLDPSLDPDTHVKYIVYSKAK